MDRLGPYELNTIVTGDATQLLEALPSGSIDLIVMDPPYNCGKDYGHWNDSLPEEEYLRWYQQICEQCYRVMSNGYVYASCTVPQLWTLRPLWERVGFSFQMLLIWHGPNYPNKAAIRSQWRYLFEPIFMLLKGQKLPMLNAARYHVSTDAVRRHARPQTNYQNDKRVHIVQKPLALYQGLIARTPGAIILDPFVGSGTTAMAARSFGRDYLCFEINPATANLARQRAANIQPFLPMPKSEQEILI